MSEKKFLSFVLTEGVLQTAIAVLILILPKITELSFGFTLCLALIIYGGYKVILSFLAKNFEKHYILNVINGLILFSAGIVMFFAPSVDIIFILTAIGFYFILSCISSIAFSHQVKNVFSVWKTTYITAFFQLFFGIILLLFLPNLWIGGILISLSFLISGISLLNMYISKKYSLQ